LRREQEFLTSPPRFEGFLMDSGQTHLIIQAWKGNVNPAASKFDIVEFPCDKQVVKAAKTVGEKKTAGTLAVERHRPLMNKLSDADRRRLRRRAAELLYGSQTASAGR
jgi:hypothetical protein